MLIRGPEARRARAASRAALPPGLPLPALVQALLMWRRPLEYLEHCRARYGTRFTLQTPGRPPLVFLADPEDVKDLARASPTALHPGEGGAEIMPIVGPRSFMLADELEHLHGRRAIAPAFRQRAAAEHASLVDDVARRAIERWPTGRPVRLHPRLRALTLEVVLRTIVADASVADVERLRDELLALLEINSTLLLTEVPTRATPRGMLRWRRFLRRRDAVDALIQRQVEARRRSGAQREDVLGLLLAAHAGDPHADKRIRDDVMSIMLAGHETTAASLTWAFQLLAHAPAVQATLRHELDAGGEDYLHATVAEVLRHRPVFLFMIPRAVAEPVRVGGRDYEPPTRLLGCIYLLHHAAELGDPHAFRPERFLDPDGPLYESRPWGGGRKLCPGRHLALLELRTVIREVLARFEVLPVGSRIERARWRSVIVTPHAGGRVILRRR